MLISLYLLSIIYTNTMGLIIINKCKPFIDKEIESKGYVKKELSDNELLNKIIKDSVLFLIPGYYLKKAIDLTSNERDLDRIINEKVKSGEMVDTNKAELESDVPDVDSIFKKEPRLSLGKYEKPSTYRAITNKESMYTDMRYPNTDDVDMDFWEEEEKDLKPCLEPEENTYTEINREPVQEYLNSISDEEIIDMFKKLEMIRRLKKETEDSLNSKAA